MKILKVLNNNVVLALDSNDQEVILTGRGLGFQAKPGQEVDMQKVVRTFTPQAGQSVNELAESIREIPPEDVSLAVEALEIARKELGVELRSGLVVPLADHLSFTIRRVRRGLTMMYPLQVEVSHLYPREVAAAEKIVKMVNSKIDVELPADEAVSIALHLVNAAFATGDMAAIFQMTDVLGEVMGVVEPSFPGTDMQGVAAARFVTHLRYFFVRARDKKFFEGEPLLFSQAVLDAYPEQAACARKMAVLLELRLGHPVTDEEILYLTMHIARLTRDDY